MLSIRKASFIDKHAVTSLQVTMDFGNLCEVQVKLVDFYMRPGRSGSLGSKATVE